MPAPLKIKRLHQFKSQRIKITGWDAFDDLVHGFSVSLASDEVFASSQLELGLLDSPLDGDDYFSNPKHKSILFVL